MRLPGLTVERTTLPRLRSDAPAEALPRLRLDRAELAGAVADLGVFVPIAVALIVKNGLSPTAVLLPAGLLYVAAGLIYRVPVPVQPLKAFGAIAIAQGLGPSEIAAGALLMGVVFLILGASGALDQVSRIFPKPIIRGIQLSVGLILCQLAWSLAIATPTAFADHTRAAWWLAAATAGVIAVALLFRRRGVTLVLVGLAALAVVLADHGPLALGPSALEVPNLSAAAFATAAIALVVPQLPLTFANSCLATADVARTYFGTAAERVRPGRLAMSLGTANLLAGAISGMPVCHGAGGMTAHRTFGARTGGAPIVLGVVLLVLALTLGASLAALLAAFPVPILAGLLAVSGLLHIALLRDLAGPYHWALALATGIVGFTTNLAVALVGALVVWWAGRAFSTMRRARA